MASKLSTSLIAHKGEREGQVGIVYRKALEKLSSQPKTSGGIVRFSHVYFTLSWLFHLKKGEARRFLKEMEGAGLIKIVSYHGIMITRPGWAVIKAEGERW